MFIYVHLRGSKCVDRRRQGDIGTAVPTFAYVRLCPPTSREHTSPKFVHGHRHTLLPSNFKSTSISAFNIFSFPFPPFTTSYATIFTPTDHAWEASEFKFRKSSHQPLGTQLLLGTHQALETPNLIYHIGLHPAMVGLTRSTAVDQHRQMQTNVDTRTPMVSTYCRHM